MTGEIKKHRWIRDEVEINFEVPTSLQRVIKDLEDCDINDDVRYFDYVDELDVGAKYYVSEGRMSERQWDTLLYKYIGKDDE